MLNFIGLYAQPLSMDGEKPGIEAWKEHTTAFDRVRSIAQALDRPRTAKYIAEEAAVSPTTAHDHLERLVEMNVVRTVPGEEATLYEPDPLYARFRTLRRLIDEHDHGELLEQKAELQGRIEGLEAEYNVDSPAALRERAAETDTAAETMELIEAASEWDLARYHLSIVEDAIDNYSDYAALDRRAHA